MTAIPFVTSRDGAKMPAIGFGTIPSGGFGTAQPGEFGDIVATALKLGYRHIDTAWKYGSEQGVGIGMRASGIPRSEIFLTTKVSDENLRAADFARSVDESLRNLQVDYVDLLLVHWPSPEKIPLTETMGALARAKRDGLARHVGVANFNAALLEGAVRECPEPLSTLQVEYHPYLDQTKLLAACQRLGLVFTAYCGLARGRVFDDPVLGEIARAKGKAISQVALRWLIQQGNICALTRSGDPKHIEESLRVFDFELTPEEMQRIHALKRPDGRIVNPKQRAPAWDLAALEWTDRKPAALPTGART
jgi:2,5-diketo-D-gluconate reductase B